MIGGENFFNLIRFFSESISLVVENLISNAFKYSDPNEASPFITLKTYETNEKAVFEVIDNGIGIPEKQHEKMFQMFQRFHTQVSYGSGLGLYMTKKSVDILNGEIIYTALKKGSSFKVVLPKIVEEKE
jgi:signal transduction histidine kinase